MGLAIALALAALAPSEWLTADRSAVVRIAPCGPTLCGTVSRILSRDPKVPRSDVNNPNPALRSRPLVGLPILSGFAPSADGWTNGRIYDPKTGRSYRGRLSNNRDGTMTVTGCILFICKSQRWTRAR